MGRKGIRRSAAAACLALIVAAMPADQARTNAPALAQTPPAWDLVEAHPPEAPEAPAAAAPATPIPVASRAVPATASWYGPRLYGNRTACGQTLTTGLYGVAHLTLPCGTPVTLRYAGNVVTVPVVDRGPHVRTREFDLTYATRVALGCPDICRLEWMR